MWNWVGKLEELKQASQSCALVTVVRVSGSTPREPGAKMIVLEDGSFFGTIGGGNLEHLAIKEAQCRIKEGKSQLVSYPLGAKTGQCCGGTVEIFMDVLNQGPSLYLFGAGHVAQAVCRTLVGTPFKVHVIDERAEWLTPDLLPKETTPHQCEWDDFVEEAPWDEKNTYVAIMTHRHDLDQKILEGVIRKPTRYIGLIGSESKWKRFQQRLKAQGVSSKALSRVKCPLGLPIGGKAPQEIAISVAAEILKSHHEV